MAKKSVAKKPVQVPSEKLLKLAREEFKVSKEDGVLILVGQTKKGVVGHVQGDSIKLLKVLEHMKGSVRQQAIAEVFSAIMRPPKTKKK